MNVGWKETEKSASALLRELILKLISPLEGAECLNYLDLNCSDSEQI